MKLTILFISAVVLVGLAGCGSKEAPPTEPAADHAKEEEGHNDVVLTAEAAQIGGIRVEEATERPMQAELKVPGVITHTAQGRAVVTPPVEGKVLRLLVTVGDRIKQGQALAIIESVDLAEAMSQITEADRGRMAAQAEVNEAESELQLAQGKLRTAQGILARQHELAKAGAFSQPSVQQAEKELNEAESELESAQKEETVHRAQLERAERLFKLELISRTELEQARLEVEQDRIRQDKAKRQIELAKKTFDRERQIAERGLLTAKEIQAAEAEARSANLDVQRAKIRLQSAKAALGSAVRGVQNARASYAAIAGRGNSASGSTLTLSAPIGGVIAERKVNTGQAVERTTELFQIDNLESVWVTANVPERQIAQVQLGGTVTVTTSAYTGRVFTGVVQVVGTRLDPHSRTMPVQCLVQNSGGQLRPGMFAQVNLGIGTRTTALAVPKTAILIEGESAFVYVAEAEGKYEKVAVKTGREQGKLMEILSGIDPGTKVVVEGVFVLKSQAQKDELKGHGH